MNTKNNKRSQETMQKIEDAFMALLQDKSLHEISVMDICDLAQIDRSTFYAHYDDIAALINGCSEKIEAQISGYSHTNEDFAWLFTYVKNHADVFDVYFKLGKNETRGDDYRMIFFKNGVYSVAKLWFENGCVESPAEIGAIIKREYNKLFNGDSKYII